jgi:hypothetical protein
MGMKYIGTPSPPISYRNNRIGCSNAKMTQAKRRSLTESRSKATRRDNITILNTYTPDGIIVDLSYLGADKLLTLEVPSSPPPPYPESFMSSGFPSTNSVSFYSSDSEEQFPSTGYRGATNVKIPLSPLSQQPSPIFLSSLRAIKYGPFSPNDRISRRRRRFSV